MKNSVYFKYAFGEIVLVVVGILIALGINNWNETRKTKKEENILLQKVKTENDYNISQLTTDTTHFFTAQEGALTLAQNLKLELSQERDSIIGSNLSSVLRVVNLEFSNEYLGRYINNSRNLSDELVYDFIELNDLFKSVKISSEMISEYKFNNILNSLESGIDFLGGQILDMEVLETLEFTNRLIILSAIEQARGGATRLCLEKALRIDSLLTERLGN